MDDRDGHPLADRPGAVCLAHPPGRQQAADVPAREDLQPFGLTINDYEILVNLSEAEDRRMRMSDLAAGTLQSKSRLSHQITRMENAGLVRRENCESDRRGLYAVLTEEGWDTMRKVAPHHVASVRKHFIDLFSPETLDALRASLAPVADHLREQRGSL